MSDHNEAASKIRIWAKADNFFANSVIIASAAVSAPMQTTIIVPGSADKAPEEAEKAPGAIVASPHFNVALLIVAGLTVLCLIAFIGLAVVFPTPTANQQTAFQAVGSAFTAGVGAILGLFGGKQLS